MATTYANGSVPESALAPLDGQPDAFLRADAAAAWNRARAEVKRRTGITLRVRGWNRTRTEQVLFYLQRHRLARKGERVCCYWQGRPYAFTGTAHAAPPGTSNHGWGTAVDVEDFGTVGQFDHPRRAKTYPILAEHGWTDTEGRGSIREPWHLVYDPTRDTHLVSRPVPGAGGSITTPTIPGRPAPITPRGPLMALTDSEQAELLLNSRQLRDVLGAQGGLNTKPDSTVLAHSRATIDLLRALPNAIWMAPLIGRRPGTTDVEVHPAVEWLTVLAYRVSDLVSAPTGGGAALDPDAFAQAVIDALPDDIAKTVLDGLAARLAPRKDPA